ncbi:MULTISPECIES: hypothetical protein [unclassified Nostoc]|nr:hypothetical protein [Nostoc sp. DedQUE03]MDZ7971554.1 hypothetical protein [Nostoc sp. DedQUE03]MDZ8046225.1 hypothetical protein [Nostoc sp. DedQUE02]
MKNLRRVVWQLLRHFGQILARQDSGELRSLHLKRNDFTQSYT